ncbi:MAG: hypothetical protein SXQ77_01390 [Halobacteria archaeon]|nr:hypothetical protein [Halobacteria archaeon]
MSQENDNYDEKETNVEKDDRNEVSKDDEGEDKDKDKGIEWYFHRAMLGILIFVGFFVALQFYFSVSTAIDVWISDEFAHIFQAAFNLVVLLGIGIGVSRELRKIRSEV